MSLLLQEVNSSVAKLRSLLAEAKADLQRIQGLQNSLSDALAGLWESPEVVQISQSDRYWRELVTLVTSGKILSVAAQADQALSAGTAIHVKRWTGDGNEYARWLGRGAAELAIGKRVSIEAVADLIGKSFSLGHTDELVTQFATSMLFQKPVHVSQYQALAAQLVRFQQRQFLNSVLGLIMKKLIPAQSFGFENDTTDNKLSIARSSAMLQTLVSIENSGYQEHLSSWLTRGTSAPFALFRASLAVLPEDETETVLQKSWEQFGDKLFVRHGPVIQQEATAQILLLAAGYVHRRNPMNVFMTARSSTHTGAISERLSSSSPKARFLGMVVGTAISQLIDKEGSRMDFDVEDMKTPEALWYQTLVHVQDSIGSIQSLYTPARTQAKPTRPTTQQKETKNVPAPAKPTGPRIIEVLDDESSNEDEDLTPHAKPDSDPEDSDEDATLVERNKLTAPVYIRDLLTALQDTSTYAPHHLALSTAAPLIRRKATFGAELLDLCLPLATTLLGLHDVFEIPTFGDLRLRALVALLVAQPARLGPWFAQAYFTGDYSLGQRAVCLSALGLGARELGGYVDEDDEEGRGGAAREGGFPSKRLPERLHALYVQGDEVESLERRSEASMLSPVATRRRKGRKVVRNELAKIVADSFFFPLTGRFGTSGISQTHLSPHILPLYLKTLAFIITAAGPSALALPSMTRELWTLLLSLRSHALRTTSSASGPVSPLSILAPTYQPQTSNSATLEALLFALLSLLTLNTSSASLSRALAMEHARELLETQTWVQGVYEATSGGDVEGDRVKGLCAGVLVAVEEVVDEWKAVVMGNGMGRGL